MVNFLSLRSSRRMTRSSSLTSHTYAGLNSSNDTNSHGGSRNRSRSRGRNDTRPNAISARRRTEPSTVQLECDDSSDGEDETNTSPCNSLKNSPIIAPRRTRSTQLKSNGTNGGNSKRSGDTDEARITRSKRRINDNVIARQSLRKTQSSSSQTNNQSNDSNEESGRNNDNSSRRITRSNSHTKDTSNRRTRSSISRQHDGSDDSIDNDDISGGRSICTNASNRVTRSNCRRPDRPGILRRRTRSSHKSDDGSSDHGGDSSRRRRSGAGMSRNCTANSKNLGIARRKTRSSYAASDQESDDSSEEDNHKSKNTNSNDGIRTRRSGNRHNAGISKRRTRSSLSATGKISGYTSEDESNKSNGRCGSDRAQLRQSGGRGVETNSGGSSSGINRVRTRSSLRHGITESNTGTANRNKKRNSPSSSAVSKADASKRRRSARGNSSLAHLAKDIAIHKKKIVIITGAGISVASGVRPFRGSSGVWQQVIWTTATREAFRKDPLKWYNAFWIPMFLQTSLPPPDHNRQRTQYEEDSTADYEFDVTALIRPNPRPNAGHLALAELMNKYPNIQMITQNVDGLHPPSNRLIEAHGRVGLYKCLPTEDSDTDSDSDDDDEREVHLGHRRKRRTAQSMCRYQQARSLTGNQVVPSATRDALFKASEPPRPNYASSTSGNSTMPVDVNAFRPQKRILLDQAPRCPSCGNCVAPQALLFDEGYHNHDFYQFRLMEEWIAKAEVIVFVGTSFAGVSLTEVALEHAREKELPVYNFNTRDFLESTFRLNAENVSGPSEETLPQLLEACRDVNNDSNEVAQNPPSQSLPIARHRSPRAASMAASLALSTVGSPIRVKCS